MSIEDLLKDKNRHAYNAVIEEKEIKIPNAKQLFRLCYTYVVQRQALAIENMRGMDFYSDDRDDLRLIARHYEQKARAMITTVNMMDYYQGVRKKLGIDKVMVYLTFDVLQYCKNLALNFDRDDLLDSVFRQCKISIISISNTIHEGSVKDVDKKKQEDEGDLWPKRCSEGKV